MRRLSGCLGLIGLSVLIGSCRTEEKANSKVTFSSGEHLLLGDEAYRQAFAMRGVADAGGVARKDGKLTFTYGALVALSGDFYATAEDLDNDREKRSFLDSLNPLSDYNNVRATLAAFEAETQDIERQKWDGEHTLADKNFTYVSAFGVDYLEFAACNVDHFGWHNMKRYVLEHGLAIHLALKAHETQDQREKSELLRQALLRNGFADHFLTDGFSAGHVRIPRAQGLAWANMDCSYREGESRNARSLRILRTVEGRKAGALAKIQHDLDSSPGSPGRLKVTNARGDFWETRSDGDLYVLASKDSIAPDLTTAAVRMSLEEVLKAYYEGIEPSGIYQATQLVPFIDPNEKKFTEIFTPNLSDTEIKALITDQSFDVPGPLKIILSQAFFKVDVRTVRTYFADLPEVMAAFREDVGKDVKTDPELSKRLPLQYIEGYRTIQ